LATRPQREKYRPDPTPADLCKCTMETARMSFGKVTHQFPYHDANGIRQFSRFRYAIAPTTTHSDGDKTFRYCPHYDRTNMGHVSLPYGLPRLLEAIKNGQPRIWLVEGEKDAEALWEFADEYATTTHLGTRFPLEVAEHFRGALKVINMVDADHMEQEHKDRFEHPDPAKRRDYPGAVSALRRRRALQNVGVRSFAYEVKFGKDMFDLLVKTPNRRRRSIANITRVDLDELKRRAPQEAVNKRSATLQLSQADMPEGPGMQRFIQALEAKGFYLEKIGPTRYKTNCPHPDHDDHNPSFEFEQGDKGVVATCESGQCNYAKDGLKAICTFLGIKQADLFDSATKKAKAKPERPDTQELYAPDASDPMEVARYIQNEWVNAEDGTVGLIYNNEDTWMWTGTHWEMTLDGTLRSRLYQRMDNELTLKLVSEEWKPVRWAPAPAKISALMEGVKAINIKPELPEQNTWLGPPEYPGLHVPMRNGILSLDAMEMRQCTPRYFNTWSLPFEYDPDAECPGWVEFLDDVFEGDPDSIRLLRQWFGYVISGRTDLEKILAIIGPTRSGKGTIADVMMALVGEKSAAAFTIKALAGEFGLQGLLGKTLMVAADSRQSMKADEMQTSIERLLSLSANDQLPVNRKNKLQITARLGVRPVIMSNELPAFMDSSNAINQRMVMLKMRKSFLGREDITLKRRVLKEIRGIFNWALEGLDDLEKSGKLHQPASAQNYIDTLDEGASPHEQFLRTFCTVTAADDEDGWCYHPELVQMWKSYCEANDMRPGNPNWLPRRFAPIVTRLGGELGKGWHTDEKGTSFRTITGIRINESTGPQEKKV
jgi:putative DNA primase/helicase